MDSHLLNHIGTIFRHHWLEIGGLATLGVSLWVAFGPMRHRLPRIVTRVGKYSATLKLLSLSGVCWFGLYRCLTDDEPSMALNWLLGSLAVVLLAGAVWVFTRRQEAIRPRNHASPSHVPASPRVATIIKAPIITPRPASAGDAAAR